MRVLVTGADGFIGRQIAAGLAAAGHAVVPCGRGRCDFARDHSPEIWLPRLEEIDAVVNCAGILRERKRDTFDRVYVQAPRALFEACARAGVQRIVQVSSLGDPANNEFIASKHRGDAELMKLDLDWMILRPSVVYTTRGAHGGTALLRAMSALPLARSRRAAGAAHRACNRLDRIRHRRADDAGGAGRGDTRRRGHHARHIAFYL